MNKLAIALVATVFNGAMVMNGFAGELSKFACAAGPVASNGVIGKIIQSSGDVLYSGATGYTEAKPGAKLVSGSQISVDDGASAEISVGANCQMPIGANSIATVTRSTEADDIIISIANQLDTTSNNVDPVIQQMQAQQPLQQPLQQPQQKPQLTTSADSADTSYSSSGQGRLPSYQRIYDRQ